MRTLSILSGTFLFLFAGMFLQELTAAAPQLRVSLRARVMFAPADVEIRMHVEPGGRRREVLLELDGPMYRSSVFPISRNPDAVTVQPPAWYRSVPEGDYALVATLTDSRCDGCRSRVVLARESLTLQVLEGLPRARR